MESLLLFRRALSSPTMCRFFPASPVLSQNPLVTVEETFLNWLGRSCRISSAPLLAPSSAASWVEIAAARPRQAPVGKSRGKSRTDRRVCRR